MLTRNCASAPENLNQYFELNNNINESQSFDNFELLQLAGRQCLLTYGQYSQKKNTSKYKKQKIISYFYKHLNSKL